MQIYSNAFNFSSLLSGDVDLRTGMYGSRISLATIIPEGPVEASREVALTFSMLNQAATFPYGLGWAISASRFDRSRSRLTLMTGEVYTATNFPSPGGVLRFRDMKLQNVGVRQSSDGATIEVMYIDGTMEVLRALATNGPFVTRELIFENGEVFVFAYDNADRLIRIENRSSGRHILTLTYGSNFLTQAAALQDGGRMRQTRFSYTNNELTGVEVSGAGSATGNFSYAYATVGSVRAISRLTDPMGRLDTIQYNVNGHQFFNNSSIPNVRSVVTDAVPSPSVTKTYAYSANANFTGFPFANFNPDQDNLYIQASHYQYWTEERTMSGATALEVKTATFNRFHLEISERTLRAGNLVTKAITYNLDNNASFENQPSNMHLPRDIQTTYQSEGSRSESVTIETDQFGNELRHRDANGVEQVYAYYPIGGAPGCPAEPFGLFQRFLRDERVNPAAGGGTPKVFTHTYTSLATLTGVRIFVLPATSN